MAGTSSDGTRWQGLGVAVVLMLVAAACSQRVEPGEDLMDTAPAAKLGPNIDTRTGLDIQAASGADITGEFDVRIRAKHQQAGLVEIPMIALVEQDGEVAEGSATVTLELRSSESPETPGAETDDPADVDEKGKFEATVDGYTMSKSSFEGLQSDTEATVVLDSQIVDSDCFRGDAKITMKNVEVPQAPEPVDVKLEGPFTAARNAGACGGGPSPDASDGGEVEPTSDADTTGLDGMETEE